MDYSDIESQDTVDYKNIALPIGTGKAVGPIEDFAITIYDRTGNTYRFHVVGGNICACNNEDTANCVEYEVR
jgi:hypothetical protein